MLNPLRLYHSAPASVQTVLLNAHALRISQHRYGAPYRAAVAQLLEQQDWPLSELQAYKNQRLRAVIEVAYARSRYYREMMDRRGLKPSDVTTTADLSKLPLLSKRAVRERGNDIMTEPSPRAGWWRGYTSGTTGSPLSIWYDRATCVMTNAVDRRQKIWAGMETSDWIGLLLGRPVVSPDQDAAPFWRTNWVRREIWFSSFHLAPRFLSSYVRHIRARKLRFLEGYPSTLVPLARYLLERGERLPMTAVITSSETLYDIQRETIERAFCCRVFDFYALAERVIYAGECDAHSHKHLAEEYSHAEIVTDEGEPVPDGTWGYLVGTSLFNTAMPLIRYRTSDISRIRTTQCVCGRQARQIENVTTKAEDTITTPEGRWVSPSLLTHPFKQLTSVASSQVIQDAQDSVVILIVPRADPSLFWDEEAEVLETSLRQRLGPLIRIQFKIVNSIPRDPSGKIRWVVSHVPIEQLQAPHTHSHERN